jgi:Polysaccharide lyase
MWLILRRMSDAFQPRRLTAIAAGVVLLAAGCNGSSAPKPPLPAPSPPPQKASLCKLDLAELRVDGCKLLASDTGDTVDPRRLWGSIDCQTASRVRRIAPGFRRLTVFDGDSVFGERCELGKNDYRAHTFALYGEGQHRITFMSIRLPTTFPLGTQDWQLVMQMKQTQPSDNDGSPVLALEANADRWTLVHSASVDKSSDTVDLWSAPAAPDMWTRFAFDVVYSQDTGRGRVKVYADLNGDGDALDPGEQSPEISTYTLKRESAATTNPDNDPIPQGASIPSHLRIGIYHHEPIACPAPAGCSIDFDDVKVDAAP